IQELLQNDDLMQQCEFNYKAQWKVDGNNQRVQCYAKIYNVIDLLEAANYCLTSKSTNAKYPCHRCLISNEDLANINLTSNRIIYRTYENMKVAIESGTSNLYFIVNLQNSFWKM
ncbi:23380_t:CDS:2, partial [Gigaspora rosea]